MATLPGQCSPVGHTITAVSRPVRRLSEDFVLQTMTDLVWKSITARRPSSDTECPDGNCTPIPQQFRHNNVFIRPRPQLARLSARWLPAAGRPPEMCGLRTRPRTDVDPLRVELPSAGAYRLAAPGAITCFLLFI